MIQFDKLNDYFDHDMEDIKSFLQIVIEDWQKLRTDLLAATTDYDEKKYRDTTHKMISVLRLTEATDLEQAFQKLRVAFQAKNRAAIDQQKSTMIVIFDQTLNALRAHPANP